MKIALVYKDGTTQVRETCKIQLNADGSVSIEGGTCYEIREVIFADLFDALGSRHPAWSHVIDVSTGSIPSRLFEGQYPEKVPTSGGKA